MDNGSIKLQERLEKIEADVEFCKAHSERVIIHLDYQKDILEELKSAVAGIHGLRVEIGVLKTKSGYWGAMGGVIAFLAMVAIEFLKK